MNRLEKALQRLYGWPDASADAEATPLRALLLICHRSRNWPQISALLHVVQDDLDLPAPAVSVSGEAGFAVWFALSEAVPVGEGLAFLDGLRRRALTDMADTDLSLLPMPLPAIPPIIPACSEKTGRWSAFIDPGMGSLFVDEAGLDFAPPADRQADLLSGLQCIDGEAFRKALASLTSVPAVPGVLMEPASGNLSGPYAAPRDFLQAVMNDAAAPLALRIEAAKALLAAGL